MSKTKRLIAFLVFVAWANSAWACPMPFPAHRPEVPPDDDSAILREFREAQLVAKVHAESSGPNPNLVVETVFKGRAEKEQRLTVALAPCAPLLERGETGIVMLRDTRRITTDLLSGDGCLRPQP